MMELIYIATIVAIALAWIINRWYLRAYVKLAYKVPSNKWHRMLGWGKVLSTKDFLSYICEYTKKYGPNCVLWIGPIPVFYSADPQTLKEILTSKNTIEKPKIVYGAITSIVEEGLISSNDPFWSRHRKVINRAFSNKNLISFFPVFQNEINRTCEEIQTDIEKGDIIDMLLIFRKLTLRIATKTILKRDLDLTEYNALYMLNYMHEALDYIAESCINIFLKINWIRKIAEISRFKKTVECIAFIRKGITDTVNKLQNNDTTDPSFCLDVNSALEYALNGVNQNILKLDEINGEIMHLFAASFETSSTTLFLVILMLAMHPQYQERAYEEIMTIFPDKDDVDGIDEHITLEQLNQLVYLEMIFNETMRVLPVVPAVFRKVTNEDLALSNGITLPVGQIICIDIFSLHCSKELWGPEPGIFNPDNFLPSNVASMHSFSFIPFTKGQRFCIGWRYATLAAKISLAKLIKTFKFSTDFKYKDLKFTNHITLKLSEEPHLNVERRKLCK